MTTVERIDLGFVNCYLLRGESGCVLVDTAVGAKKNILLEKLKGENIRLILLTHCHSDHTENAAALSQAFGAPIAISRSDWDAAKNSVPISFKSDNLFGRILAGFTTGQSNKADYEAGVFLQEGMPLSPYGVNATVYLVPGHTEGSAGVLTDNGAFIAGDAMMNFFRPTKARMFELRDKVTASAQRILSSGAHIIYPGHGKPFSPSDVRL